MCIYTLPFILKKLLLAFQAPGKTTFEHPCSLKNTHFVLLVGIIVIDSFIVALLSFFYVHVSASDLVAYIRFYNVQIVNDVDCVYLFMLLIGKAVFQ